MRPAVLGLVACLVVQSAVAQECTSDDECAEGMICDDYDEQSLTFFCVQGSPGGETVSGAHTQPKAAVAVLKHLVREL